MQAEFNRGEHIKNLPDAYLKTPDSNNYKILELERYECEKLRESLRDVDEILDIDKATGATLDLYGERVGQARGQATDEKYRLMIKAKIARNLSNGTYPSVIRALCQTFSCDPSEVWIINGDEPCSVKILSFPLLAVGEAGLTVSQTLAIVESLLPICISITSYVFDGTFQFSDVEDEYDENAGFADAEHGNIGGCFGLASSDNDDDTILPI